MPKRGDRWAIREARRRAENQKLQEQERRRQLQAKKLQKQLEVDIQSQPFYIHLCHTCNVFLHVSSPQRTPKKTGGKRLFKSKHLVTPGSSSSGEIDREAKDVPQKVQT